MGLRVNTNIAAMTAQRNLASVTGRLQGNFSRLSSGLRIASASDDAAGLGISEKMRSQIRSFTVAGRNAQDGVSLVQTAEGALQEVNNNLSRMRELAMQSANGTLDTADRDTLNTEFLELVDEIDRIANQTTFNDIELLDGTGGTIDIQVGLNDTESIAVTLSNTTAEALSINALSIDTAANAVAALDDIDDALTDVSSARGDMGAAQNRLTSAISSIANTRESLQAAESRIRDVDVALETSDLTRNTILQQAAVSVLAQANVQPQLALSLLG